MKWGKGIQYCPPRHSTNFLKMCRWLVKHRQRGLCWMVEHPGETEWEERGSSLTLGLGVYDNQRRARVTYEPPKAEQMGWLLFVVGLRFTWWEGGDINASADGRGEWVGGRMTHSEQRGQNWENTLKRTWKLFVIRFISSSTTITLACMCISKVIRLKHYRPALKAM